MFGKTKHTEPNKWKPWASLTLLLIIIFGFFLIITLTGLINTNKLWFLQLINPSLPIEAYSNIDAISRFGGDSADIALFWEYGLMSATGLIIVLILAPWLFVKGYFAVEYIEKQSKTVSLWYIGAAIISFSIMITALGFTTSLINNHNVNKNIEANRTVDKMRGVMINIGFEAAQQLILTSDADNDTIPDIRLESLSSFREWDDFEIHLSGQPGDSVLTLTGTLLDENLIARTSSRQSTITISVTPYNDSLIHF